MTKLYSRDHLWVEWEGGGRATVGVSRHAQEELGDILYVELPELGAALERGKAFGLIESVKIASDLHAPVDGTAREANAALGDEPWQVNDAPEAGGWLLKIDCAEPAAGEYLMDAERYLAWLESGD